jgi:hypothetical protein
MIEGREKEIEFMQQNIEEADLLINKFTMNIIVESERTEPLDLDEITGR